MPLVFILSGQSNMVHLFALLEALLKAIHGPDTLVLKCAIGGTSIRQWQRGHLPYDNAVKVTKQAIADGCTIGAILHFQGEQDARGIYAAKRWLTLTLQFFDHFGEDIGVPGLPVVFAQLGKTPVPASPWPGWGIIKLAANEIKIMRPQYKMIPTYNAGKYAVEPSGSIGPHYGPAALQVIASRFVGNAALLLPAQKG